MIESSTSQKTFGHRASANHAVLGALLLAAAFALGCATPRPTTPSPQQRLRSAEAFAQEMGFERLPNSAQADPNHFLPVAAWIRHGCDANTFHIYIEGDGLAWESRGTFSLDPTPSEPRALWMAAEDPSDANVIYLGRACQYMLTGTPLERGNCRPVHWTAARFGEEAVNAINQRINGLLPDLEGATESGKKEPGRIELFGYSGGGVLGALVAARRNDIAQLVTIAAPMDIDLWSKLTRTSRLTASLTPMDQLDELSQIHQHHFTSRQDQVVPSATTESYLQALAPNAPAKWTSLENVAHSDWPVQWSSIAQAQHVFSDNLPRRRLRNHHCQP